MPPASQDATTRAAAGRQRHGRGQWLVLGATVIVASLRADRRTRARLVAKASLVAPNTGVFIGLLIAGEATADILVLCGGRWMRAGLVLLIGFHVGLLFFGWWLWRYAVPMLGALVLLLQAERHHRIRSGTSVASAAPRRTVVTPPGG